MPLTFFRRMVGHRLGTPRASVEHARPCACHVLSPDITRGARRSGQGRSFAGASGFLPDVSRRGPRLLWSVQPGPAGLWLSPRRVFLAACPAAPRHQLPAAPAPPSAPRPAPSPQSPCSACLCRSPLSCGVSNEPCSAWNPRPGAVAAVCVARCLLARAARTERVNPSRARGEPCGVVSVPGPVRPPRPRRLHAGEAGRGPRPRLQGARAPVGGRYAL